MKKLFTVIVLCASFFSCASAQNGGGHYDVLTYAGAAADYTPYLVSIESYTTNGSIYHKKYTDYLYGVAKILIVEKKLSVGEKSIGFYFDKKENRKDKLFLGVDIRTSDADVLVSEGYEKNGRIMMGKYLKDVMDVLNSCSAVIAENEVKGVVIGLIWQRGNVKELINVWIPKEDMSLFYSASLTLSGLVAKSTVTNTDGRIIRLAL